MLNSIKQTNKIMMMSVSMPAKYFDSVCCVIDVPDDELQDAIAWLKMFNEPPARVLELWKVTAKKRLMSIHSNDVEKNSLESLIEEWPRLNDNKGYLLVCFCCTQVINMYKHN
jgi:hypothetical protein